MSLPKIQSLTSPLHSNNEIKKAINERFRLCFQGVYLLVGVEKTDAVTMYRIINMAKISKVNEAFRKPKPPNQITIPECLSTIF